MRNRSPSVPQVRSVSPLRALTLADNDIEVELSSDITYPLLRVHYYPRYVRAHTDSSLPACSGLGCRRYPASQLTVLVRIGHTILLAAVSNMEQRETH